MSRALHPWGGSQSRPRGEDSKLIDLGGAHIISRYFAHHISTFAQLSRWKLNVYFIGLQREKLHAINCEFSENYCE